MVTHSFLRTFRKLVCELKRDEKVKRRLFNENARYLSVANIFFYKIISGLMKWKKFFRT